MPAKKYPTCTICGVETNRYKFCDDCKEEMYHSPYAESDVSAGPRGMVEGLRDVLHVDDYGIPQDIIAKAEIFEEVNAQKCREHENKKVRDGLMQMWHAKDLNNKK
jgi:hypothetical protein